MNILIIDIDKIPLDMANAFCKNAIKMSGTSDWVCLPKGIDILQDVSVEWLKHWRNLLDEKIKALESDVN
jgi:hypothetical protein